MENVYAAQHNSSHEEDKNTLAYSADHNGAARTFDPEPAGSPRRVRAGQNCGGGPADCKGTEIAS